MKQRLITGIKPTGSVHLANYFAAIKPVVDRQDSYETFLFIADVHALNQVHDADVLRANILETAKTYLACGLDPAKTVLFQQSALPHGELAMMIGAQVGLGHLERAHAFKDAKANGKAVNFGLFSYPILMAADILLYQPDIVPVGKDQQQHLEMAREIAEHINNRYGETFKVPEAVIADIPVIPGLDGRKMSKSYDNVIGLFDSPEIIRQKVMRIVTDSKRPEDPKDPEGDTIATLYSLVAPDQAHQFNQRYRTGGFGYKEAKELLAEAIIHFVETLQHRKANLNDDDVRAVLAQGADRAYAYAEATLDLVRRNMGLII